jgi:hypothetical protein
MGPALPAMNGRGAQTGLTLLRLCRQAEIRRYRGKLAWEGDLEAMRRDR